MLRVPVASCSYMTLSIDQYTYMCNVWTTHCTVWMCIHTCMYNKYTHTCRFQSQERTTNNSCYDSQWQRLIPYAPIWHVHTHLHVHTQYRTGHFPDYIIQLSRHKHKIPTAQKRALRSRVISERMDQCVHVDVNVCICTCMYNIDVTDLTAQCDTNQPSIMEQGNYM